MKMKNSQRRNRVAVRDDLLLQAIQEVCPHIEGLPWEVIVSASRARVYHDARSRAFAAYRELSSEQNIYAIEELLHRDRTTLIYSRKQHPILVAGDWVYRRKYAEVLKGVTERLAELKDDYLITNPKNTQTMFISTISGKLGRDAEVITFRDKQYFKMNVAADAKGKDTPTWVQVLYFKTGSSRLGDLLLKGAGIVAQGRLEVKPFNKRDGGTGIDITLWADTLEVSKYPDAPAPAAHNALDDDFPL